MCVFYLNIVSAVYYVQLLCGPTVLTVFKCQYRSFICLLFGIFCLNIMYNIAQIPGSHCTSCVCVCSVHEYITYASVRLHELFLLCCRDSLCQVTGDGRKLHNAKLHKFTTIQRILST